MEVEYPQVMDMEGVYNLKGVTTFEEIRYQININ
jgi:hypothetical protein